jgi:hypothetical protein
MITELDKINRKGLITGSVTPTLFAGKVARENIINELAMQRLGFDFSSENFVSYAMQQGIDNEIKAIEKSGLKITHTPFKNFKIDKMTFGASPDGITDDGLIVEVKCLQKNNFCKAYLDTLDLKDYIIQMHMEMMAYEKRKGLLLLYSASQDELIVKEINFDEALWYAITEKLIKAEQEIVDLVDSKLGF